MDDQINKMLEESLPDLRRFVRKNLGKVRAKESPSEIVQRTCRKVLEHPEWFRTENLGRFRAWLMLTARREILNRVQYWRAAKRSLGPEASAGTGEKSQVASDELQAPAAKPLQPWEEVQGAETAEKVYRALGRLDEAYREVIILSRIEGLPRSAVARRMKRSEDSVRNLLVRALWKLSAILARDRLKGPKGSPG